MAESIALIVAFLIPLGFLFLVLNLNLYQRKEYYKFNVATVLWGLFAYALAAMVNSYLLRQGYISRDQLIRYAAPVSEEILKALILIYLVRRPEFNFVVDGAIYGFGAGIGFAVIENYEYIANRPEIALTLALSRVFSTNLVHAAGSGLIGSILAYMRTERNLNAGLISLAGMLLAISLHMGFNSMVSSGAFLIVAILVGTVGAGMITLIIQRGLKLQRQLILENLGVKDRVTTSEATAVNEIKSLDELLAPLRIMFGEEKASQTEALLLKQAEIGIKRGLLEKMQDEKLRSATLEEVERLTKEMNDARKAIGLYCMQYVREVYLKAKINVWEATTLKIEKGEGKKTGGFDWTVELPGRMTKSSRGGDET